MNQDTIRIAHIVGKLAAAGVESVVYNYYKHIDHSKYQFDIYYDDDSTVEPPKELIEMGARFIKIPRYQHLPAYLKSLMYAFKKEKYQIVHSHMNTLSVFPLMAAWLAGVPVRIAHSHSIIVKGEGKRTLLKYFLRPFSKVFATDYAACSKVAAESLFGKKIVTTNKVIYFRNAIETDKFSFKPEIRRKLRQELGIKDELIIGHVGRFTYAKNHPFLIDVFSEFIQVQPEAKLLLVGDGELMQEMKEYVKSASLQKYVLFAGRQNNTAPYYQAMDLFVMPSHYEGLPVVLIEAQTAGLPFLMSDRVTAEVVISQEQYTLSLKQSAKEWAEYATKLVVGSSSRDFGMQNAEKAGYEITSAAKELESYYNSLLMTKSIDQ